MDVPWRISIDGEQRQQTSPSCNLHTSHEIKSWAATYNTTWSNYHRRRHLELCLCRRRTTTRDEEKSKMMSRGGISNVLSIVSFSSISMLRLSLVSTQSWFIYACTYASALFFLDFPCFFFSLIPEIITSVYCQSRYFYRSRVTWTFTCIILVWTYCNMRVYVWCT